MSSSPPPATESSASANNRRRKIRRRLASALVLIVGLFGAGFLAAAATPTPQVATAKVDQAKLAAEGKGIYETSCITCHGENLQGITNRGPSLIGVGDASVYFQVSSGRMPATKNEAQVPRKPRKFDDAQTNALGAYIESVGGGPKAIRDEDGSVINNALRGTNDGASIANGSELFRMNCASCHNFTGRGGALSSGKYAPNLDKANEQQIYTAMLTGPQNMPKFSDQQIPLEQKENIIAYVKYYGENFSPGGYSAGGLGPSTEGLIGWIVGILLIVGGALWIGAKA